MAAPPKGLTLRKEDYKEAPAWTTRLFEQINLFAGAVTSALSGNLTRGDNLAGAVKQIRFTTGNPASAAFPLAVKHGLSGRPSGVWVRRLRSPSALTAAWSFTWELDSKGDLAVRFQGLPTNTSFEAELVIE